MWANSAAYHSATAAQQCCLFRGDQDFDALWAIDKCLTVPIRMTFEQAQKLKGTALSDDNGLLVIHVRCEQRLKSGRGITRPRVNLPGIYNPNY